MPVPGTGAATPVVGLTAHCWVYWPVKDKVPALVLPQAVELFWYIKSSPPKWRMCLPRIMVTTSEGSQVNSLYTELELGSIQSYGYEPPVKLTAGKSSALA